MGILSRPSSYDTGAPVPFPHMLQGIPISCFLTGYRDSCPLSSQDTRIRALPSGLGPGVPVSFLAVVPVPFPHCIQGFLTPFSQDT
jgi:hypothetical protein